MKEFVLKIITPDKPEQDLSLTSATFTTADGQITVLAGHADFLTAVEAGKHIFRRGDENTAHTCGDGVLRIDRGEFVLLTPSFD